MSNNEMAAPHTRTTRPLRCRPLFVQSAASCKVSTDTNRDATAFPAALSPQNPRQYLNSMRFCRLTRATFPLLVDLCAKLIDKPGKIRRGQRRGRNPYLPGLISCGSQPEQTLEALRPTHHDDAHYPLPRLHPGFNRGESESLFVVERIYRRVRQPADEYTSTRTYSAERSRRKYRR